MKLTAAETARVIDARVVAQADDDAAWEPPQHVPAVPGRRPGRPKQDVTKAQLSLRIDAATLERFRASGPGWQTRISDLLTRHAPRPRRRKAGR